MAHDFGEKSAVYSPKQGKEIPVWKAPKFEISKKKAIEVIDSGKYGVEDGDFWILMNETKGGKMAYTGLITSHNACLKINDVLDSKFKFKPSCVTVDKTGYQGSLVYTYCCDEQGIYEVGEASSSNCKNAYPYAMAYKRLFDRVVLKLSKLAYAGVYSEAEAEEFSQPLEASEETKKQATKKQETEPEKQATKKQTAQPKQAPQQSALQKQEPQQQVTSQQTAPQQAEPVAQKDVPQRDPNGKITAKMALNLRMMCKRHFDMPEEKIYSMYKRNSLEEMTISDWVAFGQEGKGVLEEWDLAHQQQ